MQTQARLKATTASTPANALFLQRSPFVSAERLEVQLFEGQRLDEYVAYATLGLCAAVRPHVEVMLGEHVVDRRYWHRIKPKAGASITVRIRPAGKAGKSILRAVVMIAVIAAATYFLGGSGGLLASAGLSGLGLTVATAVAVTAVAFVAQLALNALIPPPDLTNTFGDSRPVLTGAVNKFEPYGPIPRVYGKTRCYPRLAGHPYSEISGNNQYLRLLLCVGYGPIKVSDIRIGETSISSFQGAQWEVTEGGPAGWAGNQTLTLYSRQVREAGLSIQMDTPLTTITQTTQLNTTEIGVDITFPSGLVTYTKKGDKEQRVCDFTVEYCLHGSGAWAPVTFINDGNPETSPGGGVIRGKGASQDAIRITGRWKVTKGQYDVRITRNTAQGVQQAGGKTQIDNATWSTLRSVVDEKPVLEDGLCMIAVRLKATDQLNGVPREINCIAEAYLQEINDPNTWTLTRSPARAYCDVFRRRGLKTIIPDNRIDLAEIAAWEAECAATAPNAAEPMWCFDGQMESGSIYTAARQIASCGRAGFTIREGKFSVVRDKPQPTPVQHFTPKNSWGYRGTRTFVDVPHALRVKFSNAAKDYADDEVVVYADGYNETNATLYEGLELYGATSATQAWRDGRYHLAVGILRPEEHTISCDIENLRCTMGSRVQLSHDVMIVGQTWGRVTSLLVQTGGAAIYGVDLDEQVIFEAGKSYSMRVRSSDDGVSSLRTVLPGDAFSVGGAGTPGAWNRVVFADESLASAPDIGDLFMFGESGLESAPMMVKRIEPGPDLSAVLSLVPYDDAIYTADTGPIPAFSTFITQPIDVTKLAPEVPSVALRSNDTVTDIMSDGTTIYRLAVDVAPSKSSPVVIDSWEVQYRESLADAWQLIPLAKATVKTIYIQPVRMGAVYDVRVRSIGANGRSSAWVEIDGHTIVGKTVAPELPTAGSLDPGYHCITIRWTNPQDLDLQAVEVLRNTTNNSGTAVLVGASLTGLHVDQDLSIAAYWYWLRARDRSGNASTLVALGSTTPSDIIAYEQIGADNVLHPSEKLTIIREWAQIVDENTRLLSQADAYAIGAARDTYATAYSSLSTYLGGLTTPFAWNNMSGITTIARTTWNATWKAYYDARNALLNKIDDITAQITSAVSFNPLIAPGGGTTVSNIGNRIAKKRGTPTTWDVLAPTREKFTDAAYLRFQTSFADSAGGQIVVGLIDNAVTPVYADDNSYVQIDYAIYCSADNSVAVLNSGITTLSLPAGTAADGDVFEIIYRNGTVSYLRNGSVFWQETTTNSRTFFAAVAMAYPMVAVYGVQFREAASASTTLLNQAGIIITGNKAVKPNPPVAGTADGLWDSAFITSDQFVGGCTISFTVDQNNCALMVGLNGDPTTDPTYHSLDYAIYCRDDGTFQVLQSDVAGAIYGGYAAGDRFSVRYNKDKITYLRNGAVFASTATTAGRAFAGDSSFWSAGGGVSGVAFVGAGSDGDAGAPGAPGISSLDVTTNVGSSVVVNCTPDGTPKAAVPGFTITVKQAGVDVTALATYGTRTQSNMAGLSGGNGVGANIIGVTGMTANSGYVDVPISYGGAQSSVRVTYNKINDPKPFVSDFDNTIANPASSYVEVGRVTLTMGPNGTLNADYDVGVRSTSAGGATIDSYMEISTDGGTTFSALTSSTGTATASLPGFDFAEVYTYYAGSGSSLGITTSKSVVVRLMMRRVGAGSSSSIDSGQLNLSWSG